MLPGVGHVPWLEVPGDFASRVLDWLRRASSLAVDVTLYQLFLDPRAGGNIPGS